MQTVQVQLGDRAYPIFIDTNLLTQGIDLAPYIKGSQVCIVTNDTVAPLYLKQLQACLSDYQVCTLVLPDGESHKNLNTLNLIFDKLLAERHNRSTTLIALGGGVVGDMTGFAAACYQRGVSFIQVPTTLLSQVDSSVGGKTGINHSLGKNMIGAFHQPNCVLIDTHVLITLPPREVSAGLAEVIKYGLLGDLNFLRWLEQNMEKLLGLDADALTYAIKRSCECKAEIVAADERESGVRALLNLGHTFGHAIETQLGYGSWLHGEAVAAGMVIAAQLSAEIGWLSNAEVTRIRSLIASANLPTSAPVGMTVDDFIRHMAVDKKVLDGRLRFVLLRQLGHAEATSEVPLQLLRQVLAGSIDTGLAAQL